MPVKCKNCEKRAIYGNSFERKALHCAQHKEKDEVNVTNKLCSFIGCKKRPSYGDEIDKITLYCKDHKESHHIIIKNKKCKFPNCKKQPTFGNEKDKIVLYCKNHKEPHHIDLKNKKCQFPNCKKRPNFGNEKDKIALYCKIHKESQHIDLTHKKCQFPNCKKQPSYGDEKDKIKLYCVEHKEPHHINVVTKRCQYPNCKKIPTFGDEKDKIALYCKDHKESHHIDLKNKKCQFPNCKIRPSYGDEKNKIALFCKDHKEAHHIDLKHKKCQFSHCRKQPSFGNEKDKIVLYCVEHKQSNHIDLTHKKCQFPTCSTRATFGQLFKEKKHCAKHKLPGEYKENNPKCISEDCKDLPIYTDQQNNYPLRCEKHKLLIDKDVIQRPCSKCGLSYFIKEGNLCDTCYPNYETIRLRKEVEVKNLLDLHKLEPNSWDKRLIGDLCGIERPDFYFFIKFGKNETALILEVDEDQHKYRSCDDLPRMFNISQNFHEIPVIFIRYNPDNYKDLSGLKHKFGKSREATLITVLKSMLNNAYKFQDKLTIMYLFYDENQDRINNKYYTLQHDENNLKLKNIK